MLSRSFSTLITISDCSGLPDKEASFPVSVEWWAPLAVDRLTFPANDWLLNRSFDEPPWKSSAFSLVESTSKGEECLPLEL